MRKTITAIAAGVMLLAASCTGSTTGTFDNTKAINPITRESGSGTRGAFIELFGLEERLADGTRVDHIVATAATESSTNAILTSVASDPNAIGYISMGSLNSTVKAVKINGIDATTANVKNGTYPVSRPFIIAYGGELSAVKEDFISFILSSDARSTIEHSYVSVDAPAAAYAGNKPAGRVVVGGSSSVAPLMEELIAKYKTVNPNADIELQVTDSSTGMNQAMAGTYDIGMSSRELKDTELEKLTPITIAIDGIAVVVNTANPLADMTKDMVKNIFNGTAKTWAELSSN